MNEKCFCHFNGYEVKDAQARKDIASIKANNIMNIKDLGAKGDGVTDDTEVIKNAINSGKSLFFPRGNYIVSEEITITVDDISIIGDNALFKPTHNLDCFNVNGNNIYIDGINIDGACNYGFDLNGNYCEIRNSKISNTLYNAIMITGSHNTITNVVATACGWDCVGNYGNASYNVIQNSKAIRCKRHGFSTDPDSHHISFIDCYCEDIGDPELEEGHSCYHFEGSSYGVATNCKARYTSNHKNITVDGNASYYGVRVFASNNVIVDNFNLIYDEGYNPLHHSSPFTIEQSENFKLINSTLINNSNSTNAGDFYIANPIELINTYFKDIAMVDSAGYIGYISKMVDCEVKNTYKTKFAYFTYLCQDAIFVNNKFKGHANLEYFFRGRFVNCIFDKNIFDTAYMSIYLDSEVNNLNAKTQHTKIMNCMFKDIERMIVIISVDDNTCELTNCLFTGNCDYVFMGNYNSIIVTKCKKFNLTIKTALKYMFYVDFTDDLSSSYDLNPIIGDMSTGVKYSLKVVNGALTVTQI